MHGGLRWPLVLAFLYYYPSIFFARRDDFMPLKG
jgi:hypothetical protein